MTSSLHRALGAYFVVSALQFVPAAVFMMGVENTYGPQWLLWAMPLTQGLVTAMAGLWLLRRPAPGGDSAATVVSPPVDTLVQLFGLTVLVGGVVDLANPVSSVLLFDEVWSASAVTRIASPVASVAIGLYLVARAGAVARFLTHQAADHAGR